MQPDRITPLIPLLKNSVFDLLILNPGPGMLYLTGLHFHLMERPTLLLVDQSGKTAMILPALEESKVQAQLPGLVCYTYGDNPAAWQGAINDAFQHFCPKANAIGVESARLRHLELSYILGALPSAIIQSADTLLSALRIRKDAAEVALIRQAVAIAEGAFLKTITSIQPGMTERAIASELTINMLRLGSDAELPFPPIVAAGPNSADPHAVPSERPIQAGDLIVIDWGAAYQGYFSDLTRTLAVGKLDPELYTIYEAGLNANEAGRSAAKPGIPAGDVDRAGRKIIAAAGYGQFFTHRMGHGLGMEAHEEPYIYGENEQLLIPGNVFTVEPGIYLPGKGGARIEDNMLITESGAESISTLARELITIPCP